MKLAAALVGGVEYVGFMALAGPLGIVPAAMFCGGVLLGALIVAGAHVNSVVRWRVRVKPQKYRSGTMVIEATRLWETVELDEVTTSGGDFDERLHAAVARGRDKVAALNVQRRSRV